MRAYVSEREIRFPAARCTLAVDLAAVMWFITSTKKKSAGLEEHQFIQKTTWGSRVTLDCRLIQIKCSLTQFSSV